MRTLSILRPLAAILVSASVYASSATAQTAPFLLMDGTPIKLRLNRNLSSASAREGDTVDFEVVEDIVVNGVTVCPRGNPALATVTESKAKGRMGKGGKLNVNIDYLRLTNGDRVPLRAIRETQGGGNTGKMTGAMVATSLVFWPAAPFFLFMHGKDTVIPKGTEITAYINGDIRLDPAKFGVAVASTPTAPATVAAAAAGAKRMTNDDVLELKKAGFTDDLIITQVRSAAPAFHLETSDLVGLKRAGVSQAVIAAMIERSSRGI